MPGLAALGEALPDGPKEEFGHPWMLLGSAVARNPAAVVGLGAGDKP